MENQGLSLVPPFSISSAETIILIYLKNISMWVCATVKGVVFKQFRLGQGIEIRWFWFRLGIIYLEIGQLCEEFSLDLNHLASLGKVGFFGVLFRIRLHNSFNMV